MEKIGGTVSMKKLDRENINKRYIYHFFKRVFDFFASLVGLILLSPLLLYIAFRIHKEDRGPSETEESELRRQVQGARRMGKEAERKGNDGGHSAA